MSAKQSGGGGFQSAAGLMRYFDEEDEKSPKIDPRIVVSMCIIMMIIVRFASWYWPI